MPNNDSNKKDITYLPPNVDSERNLVTIFGIQPSNTSAHLPSAPPVDEPYPAIPYPIPDNAQQYFSPTSNSNKLKEIILPPNPEAVERLITKENPEALANVIVQPNVTGANLSEIIERMVIQANGNKHARGQRGVGLLIEPSQVGVAEDENGRPFLQRPGRHLSHMKFRHSYIETLDVETIRIKGFYQYKTLTLIWVPLGHYRLGFCNGNPEILAPGWHVRADVKYELKYNVPANAPQRIKYDLKDSLVSQMDEVIQHGIVTIVRVLPGKIAPAKTLEKNLLLASGTHVFQRPDFTYRPGTQILISQNFIFNSETLTYFQIPIGKVAKVWIKGDPWLLGPGLHAFDDPYFKFENQLVDINTESIVHGSITLLNCPASKLGLALHNGIPILMPPGLHVHRDPMFKFIQTFEATAKEVELGSLKIITVETGEVAVTYDSGKLAILDARRHILNSATHRFDHFMSIRQEVHRLEELPVLTNDRVRLGVTAAITYQVTEPEHAIGKIKNVTEALEEQAKIALASIFLHLKVTDLAPPRPTPASLGQPIVEKSAEEEETKDKKTVSTTVHDEFLKKLQGFQTDWGVKIYDMQVENIKILDLELATTMAQQAKQVIQADSDARKKMIEANTELQKAEILKQQAKIEAEKEQQNQVISANANLDKANILKQQAKLEAETAQQGMLIEAKANLAKAELLKQQAALEAEAKNLLTSADANRILELGNAEATAADKLGEAMNRNPALVQLQVARLTAPVLEKMGLNFQVTSSDFPVLTNGLLMNSIFNPQQSLRRSQSSTQLTTVASPVGRTASGPS